MPEARKRATVVVADDHPLYREALAQAVSGRPDLELVATASDGREALEQIRRLSPDVAVLDMRMPGLRGLDVVEALARDDSPTRVLVLSAAQESAVVYAAVAAGASGYWSKDAERDAICDAIAAIARGEKVLDPRLQSGVFTEIHAREIDVDRPVLTAREHEILVLIAQGMSAPAISAQLYLSTATVKTHLAHLYEKLGVGDRAAAVAEAMRRGLLE
ncbi:response regulator transcription factor [Baekduia soli]|uniref:Response regulator transcription factor n=1 Tax=Baekduia soli TaxID=496014 RepID=A0A5B8U6M6_9ACTN|nr:response regulator transcription factor [Baekduia soli]QEC48789.1 response regulator transcription factor [Baekduia soli]